MQEETRVCQFCQSEIPRDKKICPVCHQKERHPFKIALLCLLGFWVLSIFFLDLGALLVLVSPQEEKTVERKNVPDTVYTQNDVTETNYSQAQIGVPVTSDEVSFTLGTVGLENSHQDKGHSHGETALTLNYTVINNSKSPITVTDQDFKVFDSLAGYDMEITDHSRSTSSGALSVAPGESKNGTVNLQVHDIPVNVNIEFSPEFWQEGITYNNIFVDGQ